MENEGTVWLPPANSTIAEDVDGLFYWILDTSIIIFAIVILLMAVFTWRYRRRGKDTLTPAKDHNNFLEALWTIIPTGLIMVAFFWGFSGYMKMRVMPLEGTEIKVTGQKWFWSYQYEEGANLTNDFAVPVNKPVTLTMSSADVIHSFYVPNFRIKMDVLPNRYTKVWFEPTHEGVFDVFCTEYCGQAHSEMVGKVHVLSEENYAAWIDSVSRFGEDLPPAELGEILYVKKACVTCHSLDGSIVQGPSFLGAWERDIQLTDGTTAIMDENYLRESIINPRAKIHVGYQPVMPTYQGQLKDYELDGLIAFIKQVKQQTGQ